MFDILKINLTNFRSFSGEHTFVFPTEPGLYNFTGRNLDNPRLETNGVGKSTLLEALHWCFYGRTSRGLKAGEVVTWGKKTCQVIVEVVLGKDTAVIERNQSPNSLLLDGKNVAQEDITKLLRLSPEQFALSVMLPQFGDSFLDLKPTDKLALFSQIMELDFWLEKSKAADVLAKELAEAKAVEESQLASVTGRVSAIHEDCKGLETQQADFDGIQRSNIRRITEQVKGLRKEFNEHERALEDAKAGLRIAEEKTTKLTKAIKDQQSKIEGVIAERQKLATKWAVLESSLQTLHVSMKKLAGLGATCPTCLQTVNAAHLKAEKARLKGQIETATLAYEAYEKRLDKLAEERTAMSKADAAKHGDLAAVTRNKVDFETKIIVLQRKIDHQLLEQEQLEKQIEQERKRENPYTKMIADKLITLASLKVQRAEIKAQIATLNEDHAAVSYWVGGFKRVRLFLVEETLRQLELEVNNSLGSLGLLDWRIEFDVERENQSGGITKGFVVFIHAPGAPGPVRWEAWSGGETQRLRLAGDLGLANLIMERAGLAGMIEFFDEPSSHLSEAGIQDLLNTLYERAHRENKRIWVVEHHALDYGSFSGTLYVSKNSKGSSLNYVGE